MSRLDEIRARLNAASPWPWEISDYGGSLLSRDDHVVPLRYKDMEFVAHAPEDIAYLLGAIAQLAKALTAAKAELREVKRD